MSEHIDHKCGVAAMVDLENERDVVPLLLPIIYQLQNRGDLGAGLSWVKELAGSDGRIGTIKGPGKVRKVLSLEEIQKENAVSSLAIAHTRYATNTNLDNRFFHPYHYLESLEDDKLIELAIAFNGNIIVYQKLLKLLKKRDIITQIDGDTEIMGRLLIDALRKKTKKNMKEVFRYAFGELDGSFNPVVLMKNSAYALRDPAGRHPLVYAVNGSMVAVASEDTAIQQIWPHIECHDIRPGQMIDMNVKKKRYEIKRLWEEKQQTCFIELAYFADHRSAFDGISVSNSRYEAGKILAERDMEWIEMKKKEGGRNRVIVCGVPQSSKTVARGLADRANLPNVAAIETNQVYRSFMAATQEDRQKKAEEKYTYDAEFLHDRVVILVDDSMIRGTTMAVIVRKLRENGAREVHVRFGTPPIMGSCLYGIDFPTVKELIARKYSDGVDPFLPDGTLRPDILKAIAEEIGADSVQFLPVTELHRVMAREDDSTICTSCVTCKHLSKEGQILYNIANDQAKTC